MVSYEPGDSIPPPFYYEKLNAFPTAFHYRLNEPVGTAGAGSVVDRIGARNGTPTNVVFGQPGMGDRATAAFFDGTAISTIPSAVGGAGVINRNEFTFLCWVNAPAQASGFAARLTTAAGPPNAFSVGLRLLSAPLRFIGSHTGGDGVNRFPGIVADYTTGWTCVSTRVSVAGGYTFANLGNSKSANGGARAACNNTVLLAAQCQFGAETNVPGSPLVNGWLAHAAWINKPLTDAELAWLIAV